MKPTRPLAGLVAAVDTPFRPDGSLRLEMVEAQAAHLRAHGIDLAFVGGSTGECHSLSVEERRALARRWMLRSAELVRVLAGFGYMGASKAVMAMLGVDVGPPRLPHVGLAAGPVGELRRRMEALGFFDWVRPEAAP